MRSYWWRWFSSSSHRACQFHLIFVVSLCCSEKIHWNGLFFLICYAEIIFPRDRDECYVFIWLNCLFVKSTFPETLPLKDLQWQNTLKLCMYPWFLCIACCMHYVCICVSLAKVFNDYGIIKALKKFRLDTLKRMQNVTRVIIWWVKHFPTHLHSANLGSNPDISFGAPNRYWVQTQEQAQSNVICGPLHQ